jgi:hypothetical protein
MRRKASKNMKVLTAIIALCSNIALSNSMGLLGVFKPNEMDMDNHPCKAENIKVTILCR